MSMRQGLVKNSGSSVHSSGVRFTSSNSGGHYGGGAGGSYAGSYRGGSMNTGGGYGFSSRSCVGGAYGFGGGAGHAGTGFGAGSGFGSGLGFSGGSSYGLGGGSGFDFGGGYGVSGGYGEQGMFTTMDEKSTMQNLNDRLAAYLDKVQSLEDANAELERKIHQWYQSQRPKPSQDYSHYFKQIEELQKKILDATIVNSRIVLEVDNVRLAANDLKLKLENEQFLRHTVEADLNGLKRVKDDLTLTKSDLETQVKNLKEELAALKQNYEEELKSRKGETQGDVYVDIKAAPGPDLQKELSEMRQEYESMIAKKRKEIEEWYRVKQEDVKGQITKDSQEIKSTQSELTELRRSFQSLEIELQAQISMKASLEGSLAETEGRYCMQLSQLQEMIHKVEVDLSNLRVEMENQSQEYNILLDIKTHLEKEINTYRSLLDGQGTQYPGGSHGGSHSSSHSYSSGSTSDRSGSSYSVRTRIEDSDGHVISTRDQPYQPGYRK